MSLANLAPDNASGEVLKRAYNLIESFMALCSSVYIGALLPRNSDDGNHLRDVEFLLLTPIKSHYHEAPSHDEHY